VDVLLQASASLSDTRGTLVILTLLFNMPTTQLHSPLGKAGSMYKLLINYI